MCRENEKDVPKNRSFLAFAGDDCCILTVFIKTDVVRDLALLGVENLPCIAPGFKVIRDPIDKIKSTLAVRWAGQPRTGSGVSYSWGCSDVCACSYENLTILLDKAGATLTTPTLHTWHLAIPSNVFPWTKSAYPSQKLSEAEGKARTGNANYGKQFKEGYVWWSMAEKGLHLQMLMWEDMLWLKVIFFFLRSSRLWLKGSKRANVWYSVA